MTTPFWCLFVIAIMPYVLAGVGGYLRTKQLGQVDNAHPRVQALQLEGVAARAYSAQQNAWEALILFAAAVFTAHLAGADPGLSATAAIVFVVARIAYVFAYIGNVPTARSLIFLVGLASCMWLFGLAIRA